MSSPVLLLQARTIHRNTGSKDICISKDFT